MPTENEIVVDQSVTTSAILLPLDGCVMVERATYKYRFKVDGKVVLYGFTVDLKRRENEHRRRWPNGHIEQVGKRTTHQGAWSWQKQQTEKQFSSAS